MKKIMMTTILCLSQMVAPVWAKDTGSSAGLLLKQITSVRAEGMGSAQSAVPNDEAGALGWNPATLRAKPYPGLSAIYYRGLADDTLGALNCDLAVKDNLSCGVGLMFYDAGAFELTSDSGASSSVPAQRDYLASVTGAYGLDWRGIKISAGANFKSLHSTLLGQYSALAFAADAGLFTEFGGWLKGLQAGLAVKNLGTPLKYIAVADALPSYALLGVSYPAFKNETFGVLVAGDCQYDLEKKITGNLGTEIGVTEFISLRGGYKIGSDLGSFTLGLGFNLNNFQLDYAFSPSRALNATHIMSLKYTLGVPARQKPAQKTEAAPEKAYMPKNVKSKPDRPVDKVRAEVAEIRKAGGRPSEVVINAGSEQQIKVGYKGVLMDAAGHTVAAIVIRQVDPTLSLAGIIGLSRDINSTVVAVIDKPKSK